MSTEVGSGHVAIVPTFRGFRRTTNREFAAAARDGKAGFGRAVAGTGEQAGQNVGRGFRTAFGRAANGAVSSVTRELTQAVAKTSRELSRARMAEQDAAGRVRVAEAQLASARSRYAADSVQVIRAEEQLASATRRLGAAQDTTRAAAERLAVAQSALGQSAERAVRGMGWQRAARDLYGVLAPVRLIGRTLTGPLRNAISTFSRAWSSNSVIASGAIARFAISARRSWDRVSLGASRAAMRGTDLAGRAWSRLSTTVGGVAGRVQTALAPAARWLAPMRTAVAQSASSMTSLFRSSVGATTSLFRGLGPALASAGSIAARGFSGALSGIGRAATATAGVVRSTFVGVGLAVAGAMTGALAGGWTRMTAIEDARAKLRGLGNDADAVESIMDSALKSVEGTAFGLGDAASVAATAVAAGVRPGEQLTSYLSTVASAAAAANVPMAEMGSILNKVTTGGRAYTAEIQQIADRGLPIWKQLGDQMGVSQERLREMVAAGEVDAATFVAAVQSMSGSVATELGTTTTGALRNMRTAFSRLGATVLTPFQETFRDLFLTIRAGVDALNRALGPAVTALAEQVNGWLLPAMERLREVFASGFTIDTGGIATLFPILVPIIAALAGALGPLLARLPLIGGMFAAITAPVGLFLGVLASLFLFSPDQLAAGFSSALTAIPSLIQGAIYGLMTTVAQVLPTILSTLTTNLPLLITGGIAIVNALVGAVAQNLPVLIGTVAGIIPQLVSALGSLIPALVQAVVGGITTLVPAIVGMLPVLVNGAIVLFMALLQGLNTALPLLLTAIISAVPQIITMLLTQLPMLITGAVQLFMGLVMGLVQMIPQLLTTLVGLLPMLLTTIIGMIPMLLTTAIQLFLQLVLAIVQAAPQIIIALLELLPQLITTLLGMIPLLISAAVELFLAIVTGILDALPQILDTIGGQLLPALVDAVLAIGPALLDAGAAIMQSLADGISGAIGAVGDAIGGVMDWVGGFFPHSPAKRGPFSGRGWTRVRAGGESLMDQFVAGADSRASLDMALSATAAGQRPSGVGPDGGPIEAQVNGRFTRDLAAMIRALLRETGAGADENTVRRLEAALIGEAVLRP